MDNKLLIDIFICFTGLLLHIFMKWGEARGAIPNKEAKPGLLVYIGDVPAQTGIAILGTIAAFTVTHAMGWMNPGMALACGYMGNSVAENLANKFLNK